MVESRVSFGLWKKRNARDAVAAVVEAEGLGLPALWLDVSRDVPDPATFFAAALWATESIALGLGIVPTYPRHPAVLANQAQALFQIGGERTRLGVGPSHAHIVRDAYGLPFTRPLAHLREYLTILRALTKEGACRFAGEFYTVDLALDSLAPLPLYMSALRPRAMHLAGELADGALAWLAPIDYLRDESLGHLSAGAAEAGRARPRLVGSWPCVVSEDPAAVWDAVGPMLANYGDLPFYAGMLQAAGVTPSTERWAERDLDRVVFWGAPDRIAEQVRHALDQGIDEVSLNLFSAQPVADLGALLPTLRGLF
ncbi:MAG: LLM class flavin-dependent oxidoreductase [Thermomicrobiales bacterium]|nr:LLM class flavin-dependent oxidoreductase [Thermomicrobiales bacterium]